MKPLYWQIGNVLVTQIIETVDGEDIQKGIPSATNDNILKISGLTPHFADNQGNLKAQVSVFIVQTKDKIIVIDTGVGNNKVRKGFPDWNNLNTDLLERFEKYGCLRSKVNFVLCTHLHFDHVGWNTMLVNDTWVPTFPNARHLFLKGEYNYWKSFPDSEFEDDIAGIKDSVLPVYDLGLVDLISLDHAISPEVSLIPTPGHTPGHVAVLIKSNDKQAVITGDTLHHPCQVTHPEWETTFDTDKIQASNSRKLFLERFVDTDTLIIGAHFPTPTAGYLRREGKGYKFIL
ncbi:MAG: MBL fold metallo-hydrolase [Candidatus Levyibacteriota bacterium]